jgi:beta-lysine 5,6-aminomutase beta subunit
MSSAPSTSSGSHPPSQSRPPAPSESPTPSESPAPNEPPAPREPPAPSAGSRREVDLEHVKPYADHLGDGIVQMSFTLPVPYGLAARRAAQELAAQMGLEHPEVVHYQSLTDGYTFFTMFGECTHTVDYASLSKEGFDIEYMSEDEIESFAHERIGRPVVVVGAATGTDTHSVGIDAMLNLKGFHGHHGLEGYRAFEVHNLGSQVPNSVLVSRAIDLHADAILVSQTVTQQNLHISNLTELVEIVEAEGRRRQLILTCGGPRVSGELAKELGYDAGFSKGTYPHHVASFIVSELAARLAETGAAPAGADGASASAPGAAGNPSSADG